MKKLAKLTGNIRLEGESEKNGVAFQATKLVYPMGFTFEGRLATVGENGSIICEPWSTSATPSILQAKIKKIANIVLWVASILAVLLLASYFTIGVLTETYHDILFILSYIMMSVVWIPKAVGIFIARIFGNQEIKSFSKFLAAQNAVQNAFYDLGKVPSIEEVQTYSTFSYYSNYISNSNAFSAALWLSMAFVRIFPVPWTIFALIAVAAVFLIFAKKTTFFFWQFLIVSTPEDIHYQTALTALEESLVLIDSIHINTISVTMEELLEDLEAPEFDEEKCKGCADYESCKERSQNSN